MSTLVAQTISNGTVSTSSANVIQGSAKAWCNWNGSTNAIRSSYNVSSITNLGTGAWQVNFTNAMADANYAICPSSTDGAYGTIQNATYTTTYVGIVSRTHTGTLENSSTVCVAIFD
jgi:hypothetical protein